MKDWIFHTSIVGLILSAVALMCVGVYGMIQHQRDLEANGCQVQVRAKTGKRILVGKISHDEEVIVYECATGRRVEFR